MNVDIQNETIKISDQELLSSTSDKLNLKNDSEKSKLYYKIIHYTQLVIIFSPLSLFFLSGDNAYGFILAFIFFGIPALGVLSIILHVIQAINYTLKRSWLVCVFEKYLNMTFHQNQIATVLAPFPGLWEMVRPKAHFHKKYSSCENKY